MKALTEYINEKLVLNKDTFKNDYKYFPETKEELQDIIKQLLKERGKDADLNDIDTSEITNMSKLFKFNDNVHNINISKWNVSKVTDMTGMFMGCRYFNCDLSEWDVKNVKNMSDMFNHCYVFNSELPWNTYSLENINDTFSNCINFEGKGLKDWNTENCTSMSGTFLECYKFNEDISGWDMKNVLYTVEMFSHCSIFNHDLSNWKFDKIKDMSLMFTMCKKFEGKGLENWNIPENVDKIGMLSTCKNLIKKPSWYNSK